MSSEFFATNCQVYKYTLKQRLGAGFFGEVWLAYDNAISKDVAVKIIKADGPITVEEFKEARIGNRFDHDNLVKVHYADVVDVGGRNFIVIAMDYLCEGSIVMHLNSRGFLPLPKALLVMRNVLFGIDHLHHLGFFHNDIKPSNILMGTAGQAVLSDYGISRRADDITNVQSYKLHCAPEILAGGNVSVCTDIYQCGLTAFRLFCGVGLLDAKWCKEGEGKYNQEIKLGKLVSKNDFPEFVPTRIRRIILKAISPNPRDRYQSAIDMRRDFEKLYYKGYWSSDEHNNLIGFQGKNVYSFDEIPIGKGLVNFCARVTYPSGQVNRITQFCKRNLARNELAKVRRKYIQWVIDG